MSGINSGVLHNAHPLTPERIKELEREVLNSKATYVYLDENSKLSFMMFKGIDGIKDLAWEKGYELSQEETEYIKKFYEKTGLHTYVLSKVLQKTNIDDPWPEDSVLSTEPNDAGGETAKIIDPNNSLRNQDNES